MGYSLSQLCQLQELGCHITCHLFCLLQATMNGASLCLAWDVIDQWYHTVSITIQSLKVSQRGRVLGKTTTAKTPTLWTRLRGVLTCNDQTLQTLRRHDPTPRLVSWLLWLFMAYTLLMGKKVLGKWPVLATCFHTQFSKVFQAL